VVFLFGLCCVCCVVVSLFPVLQGPVRMRFLLRNVIYLNMDPKQLNFFRNPLIFFTKNGKKGFFHEMMLFVNKNFPYKAIDLPNMVQSGFELMTSGW